MKFGILTKQLSMFLTIETVAGFINLKLAIIQSKRCLREFMSVVVFHLEEELYGQPIQRTILRKLC